MIACTPTLALALFGLLSAGAAAVYFDETTFKKNPRVELSELPKSADFED